MCGVVTFFLLSMITRTPRPLEGRAPTRGEVVWCARSAGLDVNSARGRDEVRVACAECARSESRCGWRVQSARGVRVGAGGVCGVRAE